MNAKQSPWLLRLAILTAFLPALASCAEPDPALEQGKALLERLTERARTAADNPALRNEVQALSRLFPGSDISIRSAELLRTMTTPLDRLDPKNIPDLEKDFPWQPKELVSILGEHRGRHGGAVACVAFRPDGALLISGGGNYLRVWNTSTMRLVQVVSYSAASGLAFNKDGTMLAVCSSYPNVSLFDIIPGDAPLRLRYTAAAGTAACYGVAFHPSNKTFAAACFDNHIRIYDATAKKAPEPILVQGHERQVQAVAYSPDGKTMASGSADQTVRLWDATVEIPREKAVLTGHPAALTALAFNPAGTTLAAACKDSSIRLWTIPAAPRNSRPKVSFGETKAGQIASLCFSATGNTLAAACADGTVRLWNLTATPQPRERKERLEGHVGSVAAVAYSPDNKLIATGGSDWTCRTWDVAGPAPKERFVPSSHLSYAYSCQFSPDCQTLASGSHDSILRLWDLNQSIPKTRHYIKGDSTPVFGLAFSPDGARLAVRSRGVAMRRVDTTAGKPLSPPFAGLPSTPASLAYSPAGNYVLSHFDKIAYLFDPQSGQVVRELVGHTTPIFRAQFSPDGKKVVTCAGNFLYKDGKIVEIDKVPQYTDTTVRIWDVETGTELAMIKGHTKRVTQAFFSPDGKSLYSGGEEGVLQRREMADLNKPAVPVLPAISPYLYNFQFTPDGTKVLSVSSWQLKLWEVATGNQLWEANLGETIGSVSFASDSRHLAVSLGTGVIYILRLNL
jgi:WD40 repeat protein